MGKSPNLPYSEWRVLPVVCLTSIATIIGSGILALPVTLYRTPIPVFLILFTLALVAQIGAVYAIVELLQRARHAQFVRTPFAEEALSHLPGQRPPWADVSLYSIANLFLEWRLTRAVFHVSTVATMLALLVSYGLAGPQAIWQMLAGSANVTVVPTAALVAYWALFTFAVLVYVDALLPVFGSFTVLKGVLFIAVILIVAFLPAQARVETLPHLFTDMHGWMQMASPFLMSCVAIGGLANTCPVTFNLLPPLPKQREIRRYRLAVILALVICYLLNIAWVLAVLLIVPRDASPALPSLAAAYRQGQISTVPLLATLNIGSAVSGPVLRAIEISIGSFILVSTAVSFFVIAAGLKSFIDGFANALAPESSPSASSLPLGRFAAYAAAFGTVLALVVSDPQGFISMLTRFSSLGLNTQSGFFLFIMLYNARRCLHGRDPPPARDSELEAGLLDASTRSPSASCTDLQCVASGMAAPTKAAVQSYDSVTAGPARAARCAELLDEREGPVDKRNAMSLDGFALKKSRRELLELRARDPTKATVPVIMRDWVFNANLAVGFPFFFLASLLAAFGPYLGIKLGHE